MIDLNDAETTAWLHSGCALLVGTINADGTPRAQRAWGLTIVDADDGLVRVLIEDDPLVVATIRANGPVAVTGASVSTFRSIQLKGRGVDVQEMTAADEAKRQSYTEDFLKEVHRADRYAMDLLERWANRPVLACVIRVDSSFDQTPGPSAGAAIDKATS